MGSESEIIWLRDSSLVTQTSGSSRQKHKWQEPLNSITRQEPRNERKIDKNFGVLGYGG